MAASTISSGRSCSSAEPIRTPKAPASFAWAEPGTLHRIGRDRRARLQEGDRGRAGSPPSTPCCRAPRSSAPPRERNGPGGRTQEIQRLIGRSLRAAMGTMAFGEHTIRSTATCSRPTAAPGPPASPAAAWRSPTPARWLARADRRAVAVRAARGGGLGRRRGRRGAARLAYVEDRDAERRHERGDARAGAVRRGAGHRRARHLLPAQLGRLLDLAERASPSSSPPSARARLVKLLAATRSEGKQREIRRDARAARRRSGFPRRLTASESAAREASRAAETFQANARHKARVFRRASGLPTVADDSGLEVFALGGAPGVRSRRWAGAQAARRGGRRRTTRSCSAAWPAPPSAARRARYRCVLRVSADV